MLFVRTKVYLFFNFIPNPIKNVHGLTINNLVDETLRVNATNFDIATIAYTFSEIYLATIGPRNDCQHGMWLSEAHEFDNPGLQA